MAPSYGFPPLILASSSKYRRELLERLGLPFTVVVPDIDETPYPNETPQETALRLAREKTREASKQNSGCLIIGSDQVATLDREQIGKPGSHDAALLQLQKMRGREVIFHTALCLWDARESDPVNASQLASIKTCVKFRSLPDQELHSYLLREQPYDCAGSAKNEGLGIALLEKVESTDPTALTGLPLITLTTMLRNAGVRFFGT